MSRVQTMREYHLPYPRTTSGILVLICETTNSLIIVMHQEEYAEQLGEHEIQPVQDLKQLAKLMVARKSFLNKLKEEGREPSAFIGPGLVDNKPAIIVVFPDETLQIRLPATFEGYPVLIKYGDIELASSNPQAYHKYSSPVKDDGQ